MNIVHSALNSRRRRFTRWLAIWGMSLVMLAGFDFRSGIALADTPDDRVQFNAEIRPLLSDRCYHCHGPDESSRAADLRLDIPNPPLASGLSSVVTPGDPDASELWSRITTADADAVMPPQSAHKQELTPEEKATIRKWIEQGAEFQEFWAFAPLNSNPIQTSIQNPNESVIDQLVRSRLAAADLGPSQPADRSQLFRRLKFDLTGLPPTLLELEVFLSDTSPEAYRNAVDRLLASPQYGEHMAKYWLDLVRFADTNGIHHDHFRELTEYRDWVIRSFNNNLPFDQFARQQIAGDLYQSPTNDQLIASGFNRLHLVIDRGTALPEESHVRNVVDRVSSVGTAFLGLTVGCAVCHDHKYDPVTQRDFYRLYAFFNNIDAGPETPGRDVHLPALRFPTADQTEILNTLDQQHQDASQTLAEFKSDAPAEATRPPAETVAELEKRIAELLKKRKTVASQVKTTLIMRERADVRPAHILIRGAYDNPGELVQRGTPSFLPPLQPRSDIPDRLDLANWLTRADHPLTSRVTVNRFWQQFFGVGLVRTSEDFGAQGEVPSHPALLDYLAVDFIKNGWDVKRLVRSIVLSKTYQQSSVASPEHYLSDPDNRLLARGSRFRLDSEMIRDQILFSCGLLNPQMYGPSVKPPQPAGLWKNVSMRSSTTYQFAPDSGQDIFRRSVYTFWKRAMPPPQMTIFDAPTRESCIARRERTNTPLQALVLMNEPQYVAAARTLAVKALENPSFDTQMRLSWLYKTITSLDPDADELKTLENSYQQLHQAYALQPDMAAEFTAGLDCDAERRLDIAAYTLIVNGIFNLDIVKTRQ